MTRNMRKARSTNTLRRPSLSEAKTLREVREALDDIGRPYLPRPWLEQEKQEQGQQTATLSPEASTKSVDSILQNLKLSESLFERKTIATQDEKATPIDPYPQNPKRVAFRELATRQREAIRGSILSLPSVPTHNPVPSRHEDNKDEPCYKPHRFSKSPEAYTKPFCDFLTNNPTVFHAVDDIASELKDAGYKQLDERDAWKLEPGGKYYVTRNGSSLIAFSIGDNYEAGNGVAMLAGHVDALTAKLKPIPKLRTKAGYVQLGVAPYAGGLNSTWWDRDLGIGGRVLVKETSGKITTKLVKLPWPIARIPTLAPHFGAAANGPFSLETQMVPIIGLDNSDLSSFTTTSSDAETFDSRSVLGGGPASSFASTQPERLVKAIAGELSITDYNTIVNWELELFDIQPAQTGGLDHEFIFAGRIDDKLCSWAAVQALLNTNTKDSGIVKLVGLFDDEEVGSGLRQGARGNLLPSVVERIVEVFATAGKEKGLVGRTYANSFLISSDVIHAVNPNFLNVYLENHAPRLNVGVAVTADPNGHMTTDSVSTAILQRVVEKRGQKLQVFQIRNDSRSGGTVGPMLSSATGVRAIDAGIVQLSMHSIRATTGSLDPGLGVVTFQGFLEEFEGVDKEFRDF
jgi:aminopeptidase I